MTTPTNNAPLFDLSADIAKVQEALKSSLDENIRQWEQVCTDIYACGGTPDMASAALMTHENIPGRLAAEIADRKFLHWRMLLATAALYQRKLPMPHKERCREIFEKVPALRLQLAAMNNVTLALPSFFLPTEEETTASAPTAPPSTDEAIAPNPEGVTS